MTDDRTDAELVAAARRDPAAFDALYRRHLAGVYRYVLARIGSVPQAEDITADVFMAALAGLGGYREQGHFPAWLYRIASRQVSAAWRRERGVPPGVATDPTAATAPPEAPDVERLLVLGRALGELTDDRREALTLRFFAGLKVSEIAVAMDKRESAVKMLLHRGLAQLRAALDHEELG